MLHELERPLPTPCTGSADLATRAPKGGGRGSGHTQQTPPRECHRSLPPRVCRPWSHRPCFKTSVVPNGNRTGQNRLEGLRIQSPPPGRCPSIPASVHISRVATKALPVQPPAPDGGPPNGPRRGAHVPFSVTEPSAQSQPQARSPAGSSARLETGALGGYGDTAGGPSLPLVEMEPQP